MIEFLDLEGYGMLLLKGAKLTLMVGLFSMCIALFLGLVAALCKLSKFKTLSFVAEVYTTVIRGVPELVLILLVYYGGPTFIQDVAAFFGKDIYIDLNPFVAGSLTIGFIYGAFATEVYRGAFLAVPRGELEAGRACGMSSLLTFRRIHLPQMWRFAIPGLGNIWMILIKATALISIIQLPELMRNADVAARAIRKPFSCFFIASLLYLGITILSLVFQQWAEKKADRGVRREET
ncbi:MAG: ABC transporter permease [Thermodesulfobacteriota bacterium]|nr:ABC transporter permease [Thermodesulfobacteriota bacterium]